MILNSSFYFITIETHSWKLYALQVWEARRGTLPKDGRVMFELEQHGPRETIEDRTIWLTYGPDLVSVSNYYLVAEDIEIAKVNNFYLFS